MKKLLTTVAVCLVAGVAMSADPAAPSIFQMRLVAESPSADSEQLICQSTNRETGRVSVEKLDVRKEILLDQTALKSAVASRGWQSRWQVDFSLTPDGTKRFAEITGQNPGRRLAILIDGQLITAPTIQSPITGGKGQITGNFTKQEAKDLAAKLNQAAPK